MEPGQRIDEKYELVRQVGVGGMGEVWAAHHAKIDRHVAIKFPNTDLVKRPEIRERFLAEARVLGRLQHPNIVDVIDFGELEDGGLFLVFELLDGTSLDAHVQEMGRIAPQNAVRIAIELCRGLAFAHGANVIHRDLKPANVFLHRAPDGRLRVKILDFGISKTCSSDEEENISLTGTNAVVGTPAYMSYEQAKAEPDIDARSDIWNVGVILYEMLSGLPPFEARTYSATVAKIVSEDVPAMSTWGAIVPVELETIVQRCLAKNRDRRFQSAKAVQMALEAVLPRCSEPPVSRRLQLDSLADLPSMPPPPDFALPSAPSSSLRLYSPCAVTMQGRPSVPDDQGSARFSAPADGAEPKHARRSPRVLGGLLGAAALLATGAGLASLFMVDFSSTPADGVAMPASGSASGLGYPGELHEPSVPSASAAARASATARAAGEVVEVAGAEAESEAAVEERVDDAPARSATAPPAAPLAKPPPKREDASGSKRPPTTLVDDPGF